jgi:hypothetical protein
MQQEAAYNTEQAMNNIQQPNPLLQPQQPNPFL